MRVVEFKLVLPLILVLAGATVMVGLNLEDDADMMILQSQTLPPRASSVEKSVASAEKPAPTQQPSHTDSEIAPPWSVSVMDLTCVLRC